MTLILILILIIILIRKIDTEDLVINIHQCILQNLLAPEIARAQFTCLNIKINLYCIVTVIF